MSGLKTSRIQLSGSTSSIATETDFSSNFNVLTTALDKALGKCRFLLFRSARIKLYEHVRHCSLHCVPLNARCAAMRRGRAYIDFLTAKRVRMRRGKAQATAGLRCTE